MLSVVPYELDEIKNDLKIKAMEEFGLTDAEYEGSSISQLINLLAYSTIINNTNFTFGLNEMFISQAKDRRNVIKHARQMGYSHNRKISYQYKIKLRVKKSGEVTLNKYTNFSSNNNNYLYMGESITDIYGVYAYIKILINEYNNGLGNIYDSGALDKNKIIISEEGQVCRILEKSESDDPRLLLEVLDSNELPEYSQLGQDIYIPDGTKTLGYRNFIKIGTLDTFVTDFDNNEFKMQVTLRDGIIFPWEINIQHPEDTIVKNSDLFTLSTETEFEINSIEKLVIYDDNENINISLLNIDIIGKNILIPGDKLDVIEDYDDIILLDEETHKIKIALIHDIIEDSLTSASIKIDNEIYVFSISDTSIDYENNEITINELIKNKTDTDLDIAGGDIVLSESTIKIINSVIITDTTNNTSIIIESGDFVFDNNKVTLITEDEDGNTISDNKYDDDKYNASVDYDYYIRLEDGIVSLSYSFIKDITDFKVDMEYNYIYDKEGYLAKRIFLSDHRGEIPENEEDYDAQTNPKGWSGFYATSFDIETNILHFRIGEASQADIDSGRTSGSLFHNPYAKIDEDDAISINERILTPFKKTRFSTSSEIIDDATKEVIGYEQFNRDLVFGDITSTDIKDELEIIVKEGVMTRWNEETDESIEARINAIENNTEIPDPIYVNPNLIVKVNEDMVEAGYFTIQNNDIENTGIELFITRVLSDGSIEYDIPWNQRDYLLAEQTEYGDKTFVALSDVEYEDYINIYTRYAGTGTKLSLDMTAKVNILKSKGSQGITNDLIIPLDDDYFESRYYLEDTLTPTLLHIEGSDIQDTDSIRESAPLFSNTANRAVTKNDYKTICEAQAFIQSAEIWGGEEETPVSIPGNIFFSFIPYSRPTSYLRDGSTYILNNLDSPELFFVSYYQITGKNKYFLETNTSDQNVLFNLLDNYKIITLQLNYIKPVYVDNDINVKVLKYKFGQTVEETNAEIFSNIRDFFINDIEKFNSSFYSSSMIRYLDEKIGDGYGISVENKFSVTLYDNLISSEIGTFVNATKKDLLPNNLGIVGTMDDWKFIMPLDYPIEDLFEESTFLNNIITERGRMIVGNLTNCDTDNFIIPGDKLFLELNDATFISYDANGNLESILANSSSESIEISIIYTKNINDSNSQKYKVGSYWIHKTQKIIRLELNTHYIWHIDAQSVVTQEMVENQNLYDNDGIMLPYTQEDLGKFIYYKVNPTDGTIIFDENEKKIETLVQKEEDALFENIPKLYADDLDEIDFKDSEGNILYSVKECPLPRDYFINTDRILNINPKDANINFKRNVFSRLRSLNFI